MQKFEERGFRFEVLRKVDFDGFIASSLTLTADALFSDLTEKQMDALLTAYSNGYYNLPGKTNARHCQKETNFQNKLLRASQKRREQTRGQRKASYVSLA